MVPDIDRLAVLAVGEASLTKALRHVSGCEACSKSATHPFDDVLARVLGEDPATKHFLCCYALCPACAHPIFEYTLVVFGYDETAGFPEGDVVFIDEPTLSAAQSFISGCEHCTETAEVIFDQLLDAVTGCDPATEYVVRRLPKCPRCMHEITTDTLVQLAES